MLLRFWKYTLALGQQHGVNPWVFAVLYLAHHPLFWGTVAWIVLRVRRRQPVRALSVLAAFFWIMPYAYIMVFGHGLPWWVYAGTAVCIAAAVPHTIRTIRCRLQSDRKKADCA